MNNFGANMFYFKTKQTKIIKTNASSLADFLKLFIDLKQILVDPRLDHDHSRAEMTLGDGGHFRGRRHLFVGAGDGHQVLEGLQGRLVADGSDLGPGITFGLTSKFFKTDIRVDGLLRCVNLENLEINIDKTFEGWQTQLRLLQPTYSRLQSTQQTDQTHVSLSQKGGNAKDF